ncbi:Hypothetical_protein [Hexamita inflata]|uniref:Hypothetical_protein n=1 Tax=Hexamita inflata TaxID=28002 RepID=A0AA86NK70_9EUKA|nr:Hypothetical protein HINF_LOCUS8284 [Hexamita inflata]
MNTIYLITQPVSFNFTSFDIFRDDQYLTVLERIQFLLVDVRQYLEFTHTCVKLFEVLDLQLKHSDNLCTLAEPQALVNIFKSRFKVGGLEAFLAFLAQLLIPRKRAHLKLRPCYDFKRFWRRLFGNSNVQQYFSLGRAKLLQHKDFCELLHDL